MTGDELLRQSDFMWRLGDVAICGLVYSTFTSPPWMWFALAKGVTLRDLIDFRRLAELIPPGTTTGVRADLPVPIRFAEFYGFKPTGAVHEHEGHEFKIFRRG